MGCYSSYQHMGPMHARYVYGVLFLIANFTAWGLRENPILFFDIQRRSGCHGNRDCFAAEAVLMISFTLFVSFQFYFHPMKHFLFFSAMFLSTAYTRSVHDLRSAWHSKRWELKILLLAFCFGASIFAPTSMTQLYGKVAPFGAGLFLIIQLMSVIRYITRLNSRWCGQANFDNHRCKVITISILAYVCSNVGIIVMAFWYMSSYLDVWLIVSTLALVYIMPLISSWTKVKGFFMEALIMGVYVVFLCWTAMKSKPETNRDNKENTGSSVNWITIVSFIGELASVTVAAFSTGSDYKCIQFMNVVESENGIPPYGYGFFHFVFATGSMYFGMLFLGWDTHHVSGRWSMDVGWTSTIVHLVNEGLAAIFFVVVVLARAFGTSWLQQLLGKIFGTGGQQLADESHSTMVARAGTHNNRPPQESHVPKHEGIEMSNISPSQEFHSTRREKTETDNNAPPQRPHATEAVGSSSSSTTGALLSTSEPQAPVLGRQWGEIREEW
ncbi:hypothetical protein BDA96_05G006300 [Sorghum bicolor]|uniref:Uncharacterized protein n=1 Tax=Sorghum bicolor TaxID=4558 RepID=A0A921QWK6_SORBI|nr:hypothetical protein BDA96_05G006300 [Sorghum bicolor]